MRVESEIELAGTPYEIGYKHGCSEKKAIQSFLSDNLARINSIRYEKIDKSHLHDLIEKHKAVIEEDLPLIAEELRGLAKGSGISYDEAILLQIRREIIGCQERSGGECSLVAKCDNNVAVIAQTVDLNGNMTDFCNVFRIFQSDRKAPDILMVSFSGLLGFMGLNSSGLGIGINFLLSVGWEPGVSPYLLVRHLLNFETVEECIVELRRIRRSSSRCLTICDQSNLVMVEMTVDDMRLISERKISRTNHYLHEDFVEKDCLNIFSKNASKLRLDRLLELIQNQNWNMDPEKLFEIFSDHSLYPVGLCAHANGNIRKEDTVASVVLELHNKRLFLRKGHPCQNISQAFYV